LKIEVEVDVIVHVWKEGGIVTEGRRNGIKLVKVHGEELQNCCYHMNTQLHQFHQLLVISYHKL